MKKITLYGIIILCVLLSGCKSNDPKEVLINFMNAIVKKDANKAQQYATKESADMLTLIAMNGKVKSEEYVRDSMELGEPIISGDKATIAVMEKGNDKVINYVLKKESGKWKVAFDKDTLEHMNDGNKKNENTQKNNDQQDLNNNDNLAEDSTGNN